MPFLPPCNTRPGCVLHSTDLVNWQIVGHVVSDLTVLDPELGWNRMDRDGRGIWAGSIRYHNGRFWIYFGTPDGGIYMASANRAEGPWNSPRTVIASGGWDDPCPFWDDDGKGYLVTTRFSADADGQKYRIHMFSMTMANDGVVEGTDRILHQSRGSEANKFTPIPSTPGRPRMGQPCSHVTGSSTPARPSQSPRPSSVLRVVKCGSGVTASRA